VIPFFAFAPAIRRVIDTTNALERVHARLRPDHHARGHCRHDEAATKRIWLALRNITAGWWKAANYWHLAMNQIAILYEDRFTLPRTSNALAHGRCRHGGRTDRAHTHGRQRASHTKNLTLPEGKEFFPASL
jgi:putative transposase